MNTDPSTLYQLCFYVPSSHLETVKNALFAAGAGKFKTYERCAWQTLGQGQFKPLPGSRPYTGEMNELKIVSEYKVEMICVEDKIKDAIKALLQTHPYEEPAYSILKMLDIGDLQTPLGK